jgi:osmotically-inducible protein OsmY
MTDNELKRLVTAELNRDPAVRSAAISVAVGAGVVTLVAHLGTLAVDALP